MIPKGKHTDWVWPLSYIPRRWTAWSSTNEPRKIIGSATGHLDIPPRGTWVLAWPPYFAVTLPNGAHFRLGFRHDYQDHYYTFVPLTLKKLK
jgi:hypothetical protein